jgi:hypothetical protein
MICRWIVLQGKARLPGRAHRQNSWLTGANGEQTRANLPKTDDKAPKRRIIPMIRMFHLEECLSDCVSGPVCAGNEDRVSIPVSGQPVGGVGRGGATKLRGAQT